MLSKVGVGRDDLICFIILAISGPFFYLLFIGCDIIYFHDSRDYLNLAQVLSWKYYFSASDNGHFPIIYPLFVKFYGLLIGKRILDSTIIVNIVMLQAFAFLLFSYMKSLGLQKVESLLAIIVLLSNHFLIEEGFAGLYAEVLYFPLLVLFITRLVQKNFCEKKWFYLVFGGLALVRYMHLFCLPLVLLGSGKLKTKFINGVFFMLPFLLNSIKLNLLGRHSRHLNEHITLKLSFVSNFQSFKNVLGLSLFSNFTVVLILAFLFFLVWCYRHLISSRILAFAGIFFLSFSSIVLLTNIMFDHGVSFRERLLLHFVIILVPILISFLCRIVKKRMINIVGLCFFIALNIYTFGTHHTELSRYKVSNIEAKLPPFLKELPKGTLLASNEGSLLRDLYGIEGHSSFLRVRHLVERRLSDEEMKLFPDKIETIVLFTTNREKERMDVNAFFATLDKCDVRSNYRFEMGFFDIDYEYGTVTRVKELPRSCYEKM